MTLIDLRKRGKLFKMIFTALLASAGVLLSGFSVPVAASRCFPFQHAINVILGIALGPAWAAAGALITSTLRYSLGTGTILAFPGSLFGAVLVGLAADRLSGRKRLWAAFAEPIGTGFLGAGVGSLIVAAGNPAPMFAVLCGAFLLSSVPGAILGVGALAAFSATRRTTSTSAD